MAVNIQLRRGTAAEWTASNPTLTEGEVGVETDTKKLKVGDGLTVWASLPYINLTPAAAASIYAPIANPTFTGTVGGVTKSMVGLGSVDNTTDANKPVSTATQTALDLKAPLASPTFTGTVSLDSNLVFEGATADAYETTLTVVDPTADRTIAFPDASGTVVVADSNGHVTITGNATIMGATTIIQSTVLEVQNEVKFEGSTADAFETSLKVIDPTADRVINLPDASGTVALTSDITVSASSTNTFTNKSISLTTNPITGTKAEFDAAMSDADFATLAAAETLTNKTLTSPIINTPTGITKSDVGLANVDNTTDANKPISTATQTALDAKQAVVANVSDVEIGYLDGVTSAIQTQLNNKQAVVANVSDVEIGYLDGVTSPIQTQMDTRLSSATAASTYQAIVVGVSDVEIGYLDGVTSAIQTQLNNKQAVVANVSDIEIGYLDGVTSSIQTQMDTKLSSATASSTYAPLASPTFTGTVTLPANTISQTHLSDDSVGTNEIGGLAVTNGKLAGDISWDKLAISSTVSAVEAGYLDGVTGPIQTQLDGKQAVVANVSDVEIGYLDGVTSAIQTQLSNKQAVVANVSDTEIGYLDGVTSSIQTQLDAKLASATAASTYAPLASPALTGTPTAPLATTGTNTTQVATTSFVQQELAVLTTGAPAALNTLDELAAALGDDANYAATITTALGTKAPLASPTFTGTVTVAASGVAFTDGTQTSEGVPSRTPIIQKTAAYTLSALTERDSLIEVSSASGVTISIPTDATLNYPIGTSIDILQTGAGQVTIAAVTPGTTTVNSTPGLKLRTTWSSATLFKRAANTWVVYGDLTA